MNLLDFFSLIDGSLNFIILITSEHVDLCEPCSDDNGQANSSGLQKLPEVTQLKKPEQETGK